MSEKIRKLKEDAARLIAKGKLAEACDCYEKIVKSDLRDLTARQKLAELYARLGKKDLAVHAYQSVAGSYAADGLLLKAIAVCKIILQLDPAHTETQNILAELTTKRRGDASGPGGENVVEMPKAMSAALPADLPKTTTSSGKKSAASIRGVSANQIRGAPAANVVARAVDVPADNSGEGPMVVERGSGAAPITTPAPGAALGQSPQTSVEDLTKAAASMLPPPPAPMPSTTAPPAALPALAQNATLPDDLPIDISFDEAEPVRAANLDTPKGPGAPILTAAIAAATPSFDELMEMTGTPSVIVGTLTPSHDDGAPVVDDLADVPAAAAATADDVGIIDDDDDSAAEVVDVAARVDVDAVPPIPLFSDLPRDAFVALTERMELRIASVGDALIKEGESGSSMFIIIQGRVKVVRGGSLYGQDTEHPEVTLAELTDGAFFGEMALLSDAPRTASVIASEETMLFEISREMLAAMTREYPSVGEVMKKFHKNRLITNLLKTSPIFQPFSTTDKKSLIEKFKSRQVPEGTLLITRERPGDGLYVVLSGRCEVLDVTAEGRDVVIAELREGDVFGEMSMLWNKDTCASVKSITPAVVLRLPRQSFGEVIMTHPQILETLAALSERRLRQNQELKEAGISS